ncbi:hypothetical protein C8F01DRAFT_1264023 [Mycena amicta]|nr:hypothetical protein C8F01DRAFT_1264023 [Mycena amicta]
MFLNGHDLNLALVLVGAYSLLGHSAQHLGNTINTFVISPRAIPGIKTLKEDFTFMVSLHCSCLSCFCFNASQTFPISP